MNRVIITFVVAMLGAVLVGCNDYDQESWNQKVIVEVETPDGPVTGSSVQQVQFFKANFKVPQGRDNSFNATGEAVVVDLGSAGKLFALLQNDIIDDAAGLFAPFAFHGHGGEPGAKVVKSQPVGARAELPEWFYPTLVTLANLNDPASIERVDPGNLHAVFGEGVWLKAITVEITDEPLTQDKVEEVLGWTNGSRIVDQLWADLPGQTKQLIRGLRQPRKKRDDHF